jgi:hypothetical protein
MKYTVEMVSSEEIFEPAPKPEKKKAVRLDPNAGKSKQEALAERKELIEKGGGQRLICVGGRGYYQERGAEPIEMTPGTVVNIPANVEHWHGAAPGSWFSHLAVEVAGENGVPDHDPKARNGDISDTPVWPAEFRVDYVRCYQYNELL